ncbi:MAG: hypothetical protein MK364_03265, partial [Pirellulales bacterium]|nr:hypothetical protein [Pirellulales bacterium]
PTRSLGILTELKDPAACRTGPRQYLAYPLWQNQSPTGGVRRDKIVLTGDRTKRRSTVRLRAAERPTTRKNEVTLQMLVTGLEAQDHLQLSLNHHAIAESQLQKMELQESRLQRITFAFDSDLLRFGDNAISAAVKTTRQTFHIEIDRFALTVRPGS